MSRYEANPNNNLKSQPKALPLSAHGKSITPAPYPARHERPNYILINKVGTYAFAYESGSADTYTTGSVIHNAAGGPIRIDINPIAWTDHGSEPNGVAGDVTFVYTGNVG